MLAPAPVPAPGSAYSDPAADSDSVAAAVVAGGYDEPG